VPRQLLEPAGREGMIAVVTMGCEATMVLMLHSVTYQLKSVQWVLV